MSDHATPRPRPDEIDPAKLSEDLAAVEELIAEGIEIDSEAQVCETTWVVYGHTGYEGEVIVGRYQTEAEATAVLQGASHPGAEVVEVTRIVEVKVTDAGDDGAGP